MQGQDSGKQAKENENMSKVRGLPIHITAGDLNGRTLGGEVARVTDRGSLVIAAPSLLIVQKSRYRKPMVSVGR